MGSELTRKLASVERIQEVKDIEGADLIQAYRVLGWWVVGKRGDFKVGDMVVYLSIDSWVPNELAPFLSKNATPREYNGIKGERLRTVKLRGQISQGLLLKQSSIPLSVWASENSETGEVYYFEDMEWNDGDDLTDELKIQKWEAPISAQLQGKAKGNFPTDILRKTDQERIQNIFGKIQQRDGLFLTEKYWDEETQEVKERDTVLPEDFQKPTYEVSLKLDGSSMTIFRWGEVLRVCSRNLELQIDEENKENAFVKMALEIKDKIPNGFAFQGELMGASIQGNREGFKEHRFFVFDVFDIEKQEYLRPAERRIMCIEAGLEHVPVLGEDWNAPESVVQGLELAEGPSINNKIREGLVWKCNEDPSFSFKTISNRFLLKEE